VNKIINFIKNDSIRIGIGCMILILALASTVVSTYLSCVGLLQLLNVLNISIEGTKEFTITFVILLQAMVFFGSIAKGFIAKYCPQHYRFISNFTSIAFFISVLSTMTFFSQFDNTDRLDAVTSIIDLIPLIQGGLREWLIDFLTSMSLIYVGAVALDLMSMRFPGVGSDLIFKIATKKKINLNEDSFISRIKNIICHLIDNLISYFESLVGIRKRELENLEGNKELENSKRELEEGNKEKLEGNKEKGNKEQKVIRNGNKKLEGNKGQGNKTQKKLEGNKEVKKPNEGNKIISFKGEKERAKLSVKEQVKMYIMCHNKIGDVLDTAEIKRHFNLKPKPWYTINQKLKNDGVLETRGKRNYVLKVLEGNKEVSN